ncbi:MAG: hypothetical protein Q9187_001376 [Circinaria calcarea]
MNPQAQAQPPNFPALESLLKPQQIQNISAIPADQKGRYYEGVKALWEKVQGHTPDQPEYQIAYKKLVDTSSQVKALITRQKQQSSHQALPHNSGAQFNQQIMLEVRNLKLVTPPQFWSRPPEEGQAWARETKMKYAQALQRIEQAEAMTHELTKSIQQRQQQGKQFSPEEIHAANSRKMQYTQAIKSAKDYISVLQRQQSDLRNQQAQILNDGAGQRTQAPNGSGDAMGNNVSQSQEESGGHSNPQHLPGEQQTSAATSNPVPDTSKPQVNQQGRPPLNPAGAALPGQAPNIQTHTSQASMPSASVAGTQGASSSTTIGTATPNSHQDHSQQNPHNSSATSQVPHPLSHKAAVAQAARSYSQPTIPQSASQPSSHAHPQMGSREPPSNNPKWQIPKNLNVAPLQPVQMGHARPTLSGGPSTGAPGPMGQPGLQKHPGYVLEGEGERVLSKKKLEELVRQVTGGTDGEGGETLDPDVEETLLDVADEFVDNVCIQACQLARLRQNASLDIRDIQIILERNYNIRIPGYALDELRTVKKTQPTQAWTQKMSAVQAAKVTGGKADP